MRKITVFLLCLLISLPSLAERPSESHKGQIKAFDESQIRNRPEIRELRQTSLNVPTGVSLDIVASIFGGKSDVRYHATSLGKSSVLFRDDSVSLILAESEMGPASNVTVSFPGARTNRITPANPTGGVTNYMYGSQKWTGMSNYSSLNYDDLFSNIDVSFSGDARRLKQHFTVLPGGNAAQLQWAYTGGQIAINPDGTLVITVAGREMYLSPPVATQNERDIAASFKVNRDVVSVTLGEYDPGVTLTIDTRLIFDSYFDDFGTFENEQGTTHLTGGTASLFDTHALPTTDLYVARLNAEKTATEFVTVIGGGDKDLGIAVMTIINGNIYVTGCSDSIDLPMTTPISRSKGSDAILYCLNPNGNDVGAGTYLGGDGDDAGHTLLQHDNGDIFVGGPTDSQDFPTSVQAANFKTAFPVSDAPETDYFATRLSPDFREKRFSATVAGPQMHLPIKAVMSKKGIPCLGIDHAASGERAVTCYTMNEYSDDYDDPSDLTSLGFGYYALLWKYYRVEGTHTYSPSAAQSTGDVPVDFLTAFIWDQANDLNVLETNASVFSPDDPSGGWQYDTLMAAPDRILANIFWLHKWHTPIFTEGYNFSSNDFDDVAIREMCVDSTDPAYPGVEDLCDLTVNYIDDVVCTGSLLSYFSVTDWKIARWDDGVYTSHEDIPWGGVYPFLQGYIFDPPPGEEGTALLIREAARQVRQRLVADQDVTIDEYVNGTQVSSSPQTWQVKVAAIME